MSIINISDACASCCNVSFRRAIGSSLRKQQQWLEFRFLQHRPTTKVLRMHFGPERVLLWSDYLHQLCRYARLASRCDCDPFETLRGELVDEAFRFDFWVYINVLLEVGVVDAVTAEGLDANVQERQFNWCPNEINKKLKNNSLYNETLINIISNNTKCKCNKDGQLMMNRWLLCQKEWKKVDTPHH